MRYAHSDGMTVLCYEDSGRYMLTGGTDGDVRVWEGFDDDDAVSHRIGDRVHAIAFKNNRFFTASENNSIQIHTFPDGSLDGIMTRFSAPVTHMCFNKSGTKLVAGSSDFTVKLVEVANSSQTVFHGHEAPILSVALDPQDEFVASASCDGTVRVWKSQDQTCVKSLDGIVPKCADISLSKSLCRLAWSPDGQFLVVPGDKEVCLYKRNTWEKASITDSDITQRLSIVEFSPSGRQIAVTSCAGQIHILDWTSRKLVDTQFHENKLNISALAWNPSNGTQIAYCDVEGQLGVLKVTSGSVNKVNGNAIENNEFAGVFDDSDDDMLLQASNCSDPTNVKVSQDGALPDGDVTSQGDRDGAADDDDDDDDDGDFLKGIRPAKIIDDNDDASSTAGSVFSEPMRALPPPVDVFKPTPMQKPFQSGSSPAYLSNRYMVWNSVGIVKQYVSDEEHSIDVEFHNSSTHHPMHLTNSLECHIADLNSEALVLACAASDDGPSKVLCMHFGSWDNSKEWTVSLPEGEEVQALTVGDGFIAVATDARNVRVFTVGGVQTDIFSIPGPVVCLSSHAHRLIIVFHAGMGIPGDQCLGVILTSTRESRRNPLNGNQLPLSPKSTLQWLGFSSEGTPFYMDSAGVVRRLHGAGGPIWTEVANTKQLVKGKSDHYWVVGISERPQQLRCILCKGARYPQTLPRPSVSILPFSLPLCEKNTEKSQYEETLLQTRLFAATALDRQEALRPAQEALMKLFALSARSDREVRALEVCGMMKEEHTLQLAIKYASRLKHMQLAQRIGDLAQQRAEQEEARDEESESGDWGKENRDEMEEEEEAGEEDDYHAANGHVGSEDEDDADGLSGPKLNLQPKQSDTGKPIKSSLSRSNPFKVSSQRVASHATRGSQVFDKISAKPDKTMDKVFAPLPVTINSGKLGRTKKNKSINAMFNKNTSESPKVVEQNGETETTRLPTTGFQLWLSEHRDELQSECPDLSEEDLGKLAAERFRELPKPERQSWSATAKKEGTAAEDASPDVRKRKRSGDCVDDELSNKKANVKKPQLQAANKLSNFAFGKN